ncbi:MAG: signal peptide peptidase SppA [Nitrospinota bacterium]|nr:signal peptide peptidase SppA [Nitrospinota bacterium]MDH5755172.1 signal peptide peptidase SppA [Nitrospinota bacterium]
MTQSGQGRNSARSIVIFFGVMAVFFLVGIWLIIFATGEGIDISGDKVALVRVENIILDSEEINSQLKRWVEDDSVKAIVLRINSPGGAVAPSQEIYEEVERAVKKKPVVASMGAVAASGGYYVAAPCSVIFANPGTVTGSIGVIMNLSNIEKLLGKIGLSPMVIKTGKFKDIGSPYRPMSDDDRQLLQGVADDILDQFIEDVAKGRKMEPDHVRSMADGRIFTGREAVELNLVDKMGNLRDSIEAAARMAKMNPDPEVVEEEERRGFADWLLDGKANTHLARAGMTSGFYYIWPAW